MYYEGLCGYRREALSKLQQKEFCCCAKNTKPNKSDAFAVHVLARRVLNCSNENKAGSETRDLAVQDIHDVQHTPQV